MYFLGQKAEKTTISAQFKLPIWLLLLGWVALCAGCVSLDNPASIQRFARIASIGSAETVVLREVKPNSFQRLKDSLYQPLPDPSDRDLQILRRYSLDSRFEDDRADAVGQLWDYAKIESNADSSACVASLAHQQAEYHRRFQNRNEELDWRLLALLSASDYLWSPRFSRTRNAYDPFFAEATETYNRSVEGLLRHLKSEGNLRQSHQAKLESRWVDISLSCDSIGQWNKENIERFEFVSDFDINGLTNHHIQYGVGVPLIAVRKKQNEGLDAGEKFYPPGLTLPLTAFISIRVQAADQEGKTVASGQIQLIDPLRQDSVAVGGYDTPIASDITAPLAYYLNDPLYRSNLLATASLLNADIGKQVRGLYMLEPYDPAKIPVVMVHGFWSSAITWNEMFNDLRANSTLSSRYQFWFYMYPTGQPFWVSAQQMRDDLQEARQKLDPEHNALALDEMVLVGHSMGGLISLLQTVESEDHFWKLASDHSIDELQGDPASIEQLRKSLFFSPNQQVKRVVTLATPYKGSDFANPTTRWLGRKLVSLPPLLVKKQKDLIQENPGFFKDKDLLTIQTSIDSLAPDSPFFDALDQTKPAPWTRYHVVVGHLQPEDWQSKWQQSFIGDGDGVVDLASAKFEHASSYDEVDSKHMLVHQHPRSIWIVKQVLLQHLAELAVDTPTDAFRIGDMDHAELANSQLSETQEQSPSDQSSFNRLQPARVTTQQTEAADESTPNLGQVQQVHHLYLDDDSTPAPLLPAAIE